MLREDTSFFFLINSLFFVFFLLFYVIINFYKNYFIIIILLYIFFMKIILFFHVPECSGMFRNVPECSMFQVLSTPILKLSTVFVLLSNLSSLTLNPVYLKWTANVVAIHVHCRKYNSNRLQKFCIGASLFVFNFSRPTQ